jgi:hypothetical protein
MVQASLSRGSTSVTFQVEQEPGGQTVIQTTGKPQQEILETSSRDPRVSDQFAAVKSLTVNGYIDGSNAYEDARVMAEDLVKPHSNGAPLQLDVSNLDGFSTYDVAPDNASALKLTYNPGERRFVRVAMSVTQVDETIGGAASDDQTGSGTTPNDGGGVTITNPGTNTSVTINEDLTVTRTVGRPNTTIRPDPTGVTYVDKNRAAEDVFEIEGQLVSGTARSDSQTLINILSASRGRQGLDLTFDNHLYGLGSYDVSAVGGESGRRIVSASEPGMASVRNITLRTITT